MHPGPMNRGLEISAEAADGPRSTIVEQVANGVAVRMAVLYLLLAGRAATGPATRDLLVMTGFLIRGARPFGGRRHRPAAARRPDRGRRCRTWTPPAPQVVDADGLVALPGLVDLHTHLREPGREDAETVGSGTRAAAARRVHRRPRDGQHQPGGRHRRRRGAGVAARPRGRLVDVAAGRCGDRRASRGEQLAELGAMADSAAGVRVFSDDGHCVADPC